MNQTFIDTFRQKLSEYDLNIPEIIPDGCIRRFSTWGDRSGEASGAYWHNGNVGWFQDWRTMQAPEIVKGKLSKADQEALSGSFTGASNKVSREALESGIRRIWDAGTEPDGHPYLKRKGITAPQNVKVHDGLLIIPVMGINENKQQLNGLQRIGADGKKRFLAGTRKKGSMFGIGGNGTYIICEGFATGVSLHEATGASIAVAFDAGNLLPVAREVAKKIDPKNIIIAGDNDTSNNPNKGVICAEAAGKATGATVVLPEFRNPDGEQTTDFNDLHRVEGLDAVRNQIEVAEERLAIIEEGNTVEEKPQTLEFPVEVISGIAGDYANLMTEYIEAPIQFPYFSFLTCLGAVLSGRLTIRTVHRPQPRLYVLLLGPSGESRKSTIIEHTTELFRLTLTHDSDINICWGVGSDIGLLKKLKKFSSLLLCLDEFKQLTSKSGITGSNLLPCISTLFDRNRYENQTKKESESITLENAHLNILAASTPETYESTWNPEFTNIGLNNRLWIVPGVGRRGNALSPEIPEKEFSPTKTGIGNILLTVGGDLRLDISKEGQDLYENWYQNREPSVHSQRLETYALRLMSLLTVNDFKTEVDRETVQKVITLCDWQLKARKFYTPIDADNKVAKMEEKIRRVLGAHGALTKPQLFAYTNAKRGGHWEFKMALANLIEAGEVGQEERQRSIKFFLI